MENELRSVVLAAVAAAVITPLLGRWLSRAFPPKAHSESDSEPARHPIRNAAIEWLGTLFFLVGVSVPFVMSGSDRLESSLTSIALMVAFGLLFLVGSVVVMTSLFGDRNAESFLAYYESKRGISRSGARKIAKALVVGSVFTLVIMLLLSF